MIDLNNNINNSHGVKFDMGIVRDGERSTSLVTTTINHEKKEDNLIIASNSYNSSPIRIKQSSRTLKMKVRDGKLHPLKNVEMKEK